MAIYRVVVALFFALTLAKAELKGSVTCLDCPQGYDLSGIQVLVKCDHVKKLAMAYTEEDGTFRAGLPSDGLERTDPSSCVARIMGGPRLIYTSTRDSFVPFVEPNYPSHNDFTTSEPLSFYKACPLKGKCRGNNMGFASSKTVDFPVPREWGLAPTSYYVPYVPIIGIP